MDGDLADKRYRENSVTATMDLAVTGSLWGVEKPYQWYCLYALAGSGDTTFSLKAMPLMRVSSQGSQVITLRNNANTADIGYGLTANELVEAKILVLTGVSRGLLRQITANNSDNGAADRHLWRELSQPGPGGLVGGVAPGPTFGTWAW